MDTSKYGSQNAKKIPVLLLLCSNLLFAVGQPKFACPPGSYGWPCLRDQFGSPQTIRVIFIEEPYFTSNPAALLKVASNGNAYEPGVTCDSNRTAVAECFRFENWNGGWIGAFMNKALSDLGVNVIAMTKANFSYAAMTADTDDKMRCIWEVKLGNADMCVGDFWSTPSGRNLTAFTTMIDSDILTLYTTLRPASNSPYFPYRILAVFAPFERSVWLMAGIAIFACTIALRVVEAPPSSSKRHTMAHVFDCNHGWAPPTAQPPSSPRGSCLVDAGPLFDDVFTTFMSFYGGSSLMLGATRTWPARLITIGVGIFVFVHVNSYTSSLAAFYVSSSTLRLGRVATINDIKATNGHLCITQGLAAAALPSFLNLLPPEQLLVIDQTGPMLEALYQGRCAAAVLGKYEKLLYISASVASFFACTAPGDPHNFTRCVDPAKPATAFDLSPAACAGSGCAHARRYCDLLPLSEDAVSGVVVTWALPVAGAIEPWVSWLMLRIHSDGNLTTYRDREVLEPNPVVCPGPAAPPSAISLEAISSILVVCGTGLFLAVALHAASHVLVACRRRRSAARPADPAARRPSKKGAAAAAAAPRLIAGGAGGAFGQRRPAAMRRTTALEDLSRLLGRVQRLDPLKPPHDVPSCPEKLQAAF